MATNKTYSQLSDFYAEYGLSASGNNSYKINKTIESIQNQGISQVTIGAKTYDLVLGTNVTNDIVTDNSSSKMIIATGTHWKDANNLRAGTNITASSNDDIIIASGFYDVNAGAGDDILNINNSFNLKGEEGNDTIRATHIYGNVDGGEGLDDIIVDGQVISDPGASTNPTFSTIDAFYQSVGLSTSVANSREDINNAILQLQGETSITIDGVDYKLVLEADTTQNIDYSNSSEPLLMLATGSTCNKLSGSSANDIIIAEGFFIVNGMQGDDNITTNNTNIVNGNSGNDTLNVFNSKWAVNAGAGDDIVNVSDSYSASGNEGNDVMNIKNTNIVNGNSGDDIINFEDTTLTEGIRFGENITNLGRSTLINRRSAANYICGGSGNDIITTVNAEYVKGQNGDDIFNVTNALHVNGGNDFDTLNGSNIAEHINIEQDNTESAPFTNIFTDYADFCQKLGLSIQGNTKEAIRGAISELEAHDINKVNIAGKDYILGLEGNASSDYKSYGNPYISRLILAATDYDNVSLSGSYADDIIIANGFDKVDGLEGNDIIFADNIKNKVQGGNGDDILFAKNSGTVHGGNGNDIIFAQNNKSVHGGFDNDFIAALNTEDIVHGGNGDDYIYANGARMVLGSQGKDCINTSNVSHYAEPSDCDSLLSNTDINKAIELIGSYSTNPTGDIIIDQLLTTGNELINTITQSLG